jgi:archaellum biogenesis protein FlaJ (TadC family)
MITQYPTPSLNKENKLLSSPTEFTPLHVLQIFATALIAAVTLLSSTIVVMKTFYDWNPYPSYLSYSPVHAVATAGACLVLSFLIPEFLLDSARREMNKETPQEQDEDLPTIFIPSIFIRFALLSVITIIGFIMAFSGRSLSVFLPFAVISLVLMIAYFPTEARMHRWLQTK